MKKITVISLGDPFNVKTWSKSPFSLAEAFKNKQFEVGGINLLSFYGKIEEVFFKIQRHTFIAGICRSFFLYKKTANAFNKVVERSSDNNYLFVSEHCLNKPHVGKNFYLYVDAAIRPYYKYMPMNFIQRIIYHFTLGIYEKNDRRSYSFMNKIFTLNEWTRRFLINEYELQESKVVNVGVGVNLVPMTEEKKYDNNLLLIVLRKSKTIERIKGLPILLQAYRMLRRELPDVKLAVVGTTGEEEEGVTYYYNQPRSKTVELFKACTLYVMPALCEPNGTTYLEALANKSPIVGLNRFAFPEFSGYGKYGFICPDERPETLAHVLKDALSDKEKLERMGMEGQNYVLDRFSWDKVVEKIIAEMK